MCCGPAGLPLSLSPAPEPACLGCREDEQDDEQDAAAAAEEAAVLDSMRGTLPMSFGACTSC